MARVEMKYLNLLAMTLTLSTTPAWAGFTSFTCSNATGNVTVNGSGIGIDERRLLYTVDGQQYNWAEVNVEESQATVLEQKGARGSMQQTTYAVKTKISKDGQLLAETFLICFKRTGI